MKKSLLWISALLLAASSAGGALYYKSKHKPPPYAFTTEPVTKRHIVGKVTATGTLLATVTVQVGTQVSGRIQKLNADYNSEVKKGQLVAKIDPLLFETAVDNARANYLQAKAQLESAKATLALDKKLYARELALQKDNLASQQDVETAQTNADVAEANVHLQDANVAQMAAQLHTADANLGYTNIISPIDGTVISRSVDVGQTVAASLSAPTLFTIAEDLHKMQVNTNISEGDVGRLKEGMDASFTVDAFPGRVFKGKISQIRNAATTLQNVVTYDAVIDVKNDDLQLRPGMTANTTVVYAEKDDALSVSNAALRFRPPPEVTAPDGSGSEAHHHGDHPGDHPGGHEHGGDGRDAGVDDPASPRPRHDRKPLWVEKDGLASQIHVRLGLTDGSFTEVLGSSVHEGDPVINDATQTSKGSGSGGGGGSRRMFF